MVIRKLASVVVAATLLSSAAALPAGAVAMPMAPPPSPGSPGTPGHPGKPGGPGESGPGRSPNGWGDGICRVMPWICR